MLFIGKGGKQYAPSATRLAGGGEGDIFVIQGNSSHVAKIYKPGKTGPEKELKLIRMVDFPPDISVLNQIAWPQDVLYDSRRQFAGFIMPKLETFDDLNIIYEPGSSSKYPDMPWESKIIIAENLCAVLHAVHAAGHICGDFNPKNISVDPDTGFIVFLDTDSYHIRDGQKTYRCDVAIPEYLAAEIQAKMRGGNTLATAPLPTFTQAADHFALAVHIFQLLMNGAHPFACALVPGRQTSVVAPQPSDNIIRGAFPFMQNIPGVKIPVYAPQIEILPAEIQQLFRRAFIQGYHTPSARPNPEEWHSQLRTLRNNLRQCARIPHHQYYAKLEACPWCRIENAFAQTVLTQTPIAPTGSRYATQLQNRNAATGGATGYGGAGSGSGIGGSTGTGGTAGHGGSGWHATAAGTQGSAPPSTMPRGRKIFIGILTAVLVLALAILVDIVIFGGPLTSSLFGKPSGPQDSVNIDSPNGGDTTESPTDIPTDTPTGDPTGEPTGSPVTPPDKPQTDYSIIIDANDDRLGLAESSQIKAPETTTIFLNAAPSSGCEFVYWEIIHGDVRLQDIFSPSTSFTMPGGDVSIRAHFREHVMVYGIEIIENDPAFGRAGADLELAERGNTVNIFAEPNPGYEFERWGIVSGDFMIANSADPNTSFIMPGHAISIIAYFWESGLESYNIYVIPEPSDGGSAETNYLSATYGTTVDISVSPAEGFEFDHVEISSGDITDVIDAIDNLSFTMPYTEVTVRVYFSQIISEG